MLACFYCNPGHAPDCFLLHSRSGNMTVFIALQVRHHDCFYYNTGQVFIAIQVRFLLQYRSGFYYNTSQDFITIQVRFLLQYKSGFYCNTGQVFITIQVRHHDCFLLKYTLYVCTPRRARDQLCAYILLCFVSIFFFLCLVI